MSAEGLPSASFTFLGGLAKIGKEMGQEVLFSLTRGGKGVGSLLISSSAARILTSNFKKLVHLGESPTFHVCTANVVRKAEFTAGEKQRENPPVALWKHREMAETFYSLGYDHIKQIH